MNEQAREHDHAKLISILQRANEVVVWVVGDIMLDEYAMGEVDRISPEAPVPVLRVREVKYRLGGAANVARQISALGAFLAIDDSLPGLGAEGEKYRTLDGAATARTALSSEVAALGTPDEVAEEIAAIRSALDASAASVRSAADAAAACSGDCVVSETPEWEALTAARSSEASAVTSAVVKWRAAVAGALKEIRQRELPARPKI